MSGTRSILAHVTPSLELADGSFLPDPGTAHRGSRSGQTI